MSNLPQITFKPQENPLAHRIYERLLAKGVTPKQIDQGYWQRNFNAKFCPKVRATSCLLSWGDGRIFPQEIFRYALAREHLYRKLLEKELPLPMGWHLDDLNPKTDFDEKIRKETDKVIQILHNLILQKGFKKGSEEYRERMATGLCLYVGFPDVKTILKKPKSFEKYTRTLVRLGLVEFKEYLAKNGGLNVKGELSVERTALEAIQKKKGKCTEQSKILYAVLMRAGIKPQFVLVNPWKTKDEKLKIVLYKNPSYLHVCIGVYINGKLKLFDPAIFSADPPHDDYYPLSLRQFLSLLYLNYSAKKFEKDDINNATKIIQDGLLIDPKSPYLLLALGVFLSKKGDLKKGTEYYKKVLEFQPDNFLAYLNLGKILLKANPDQAISFLQKSIQINPKFYDGYFVLGDVFIAKGDFRVAKKYFLKILEFYPDHIDTHLKLGSIHMLLGDFNQSIAAYSQAIKFPESKQHSFYSKIFFWRGSSYFKNGDYQKAKQDYEKAINLDRNFFLTHGALGLAEAKLGNFKKARASFDFYFKLSRKPTAQELNDIVDSLKGFYLTIWNKRGLKVQKKTFETETGLDITNVEGMIEVTQNLWEARHRKISMGYHSVIPNLLKEKIKLLSKKNQKLSKITQQLLKKFFFSLPESMRNDEKVKELWRGIF